VLFVAALRSAVKDRVVAHQELRAAGIAGVAVIEGVALARERADAVSLGEVAVNVRPARARVLDYDSRQVLTGGRLLVQQLQKRELVGLEQRRGWVVRHPFAGRYAVIEVEVAFVAGRPVEAPAHALPIGEQLLDRRARDADHRHVAGLEVGEYAVE